MRINILILMLSFAINSSLHAKERTCAKMLSQHSIADAIFATTIPFFGWIVIPFVAYDATQREKSIKIMKAATKINNSTTTHNNTLPLGNEYEIMAHFYEKLIKRYPKMELGIDEVIAVVDKYNRNGAKNGKCNPFVKLSKHLFPDQKTKEYLEFDNEWQQKQDRMAEKQARELEHASTIRREKNGEFDVIYYQGHDI